ALLPSVKDRREFPCWPSGQELLGQSLGESAPKHNRRSKQPRAGGQVSSPPALRPCPNPTRLGVCLHPCRDPAFFCVAFLHQGLVLSSPRFGQIGAFAKLCNARDVAAICDARGPPLTARQHGFESPEPAKFVGASERRA